MMAFKFIVKHEEVERADPNQTEKEPRVKL